MGFPDTCRLIPCSCFWHPILALGIYNHEIGYPKKGMWQEPIYRYVGTCRRRVCRGSTTWASRSRDGSDRSSRAKPAVRFRLQGASCCPTIPLCWGTQLYTCGFLRPKWGGTCTSPQVRVQVTKSVLSNVNASISHSGSRGQCKTDT